MYLPFNKKSSPVDSSSLNDAPDRTDRYSAKASLEISEGMKNFALYQEYNYFHWPYWIARYTNRQNERIQSLPYILHNNHCRTWYTINSFLSRGALRIDPSGMVHPVWARWSVEFWMHVDGMLVRFYDDDYIHQENDKGIVKTSCRYPAFDCEQLVYITRTNIDEAVVVNKIHLKKKNSAHFIIAFRPYTTISLSGIDSIEYMKNNIIRINNDGYAALLNRPDFILTGNELTGDIDFQKKENKHKINSSNGMAAMAFVYQLKNENEIGVRIAVNEGAKINVPQFSVKSTINDYSQYINLRMKEGVGIIIGKQPVNQWVDFCKYSTLVQASNYELNSQSPFNSLKHHYYTIAALNRMGYHQQSRALIDYCMKNFTMKDDYASAVSASIICNSAGDYYRTVKDTAFLQEHYPLCRDYAQKIARICKDVKKLDNNVVMDENPFIDKNNISHIPIISSGLENVAFMSRSLGLFGDETRILADSHRLEDHIIKTLFRVSGEKTDGENALIEWIPTFGKPVRKHKLSLKDSLEFSNTINVADNKLIFYSALLFPFLKNMLSKYTVNNVIDSVLAAGKGLPLFNTIISGVDIVHSLYLANSMILSHDKRAVDIINAVITQCSQRKFMPDYLNPVSGHAIVKEPISIVAVSLLFQAIRNFLFVDHPERLEMFPIPVSEWLLESPVSVTNAPSRFGNISFTAAPTSDEFIIQFAGIPQFVPPDILINLPFKAKIKKSDDFIVKYETGKSWCINGWPEEIRFKR